MQVCEIYKPAYKEVSEGHGAACWLLHAKDYSNKAGAGKK
jgi:hypothetical protein